MEMLIHDFELPLVHPFGIFRGTTYVAKTMIVELRQNGLAGYGEATENDYYGYTIESMRAALEEVRQEIEATELNDPIEFWEQMHPALSKKPFVQCALDNAAHDLWGKLQGQPVWKLWGLSLDKCPLTDYTIGIDEIDVMVKKMREFEGWPIFKVKLGTKHDIDIVRALREHTDAVFRVDANCGWTADEAIRNSEPLAELGVEFIEQPLQPDDWEGMRRVYRESVLPVVADESCQIPPDVDRCNGYFHGVNVKLCKCGGLTPGRRMLLRAHELGLKTMVGCMSESTVAMSAIAQLLPMLDYVDMDGALLLAKDTASGVSIERGKVHFPEENGLGIRLYPEPR
ncbi:MAG TPA: dipeptide epimerase [Planctomycetaceae bacterium]|nr:dipeptide epimerase [Planctomycetaceae bacterium]